VSGAVKELCADVAFVDHGAHPLKGKADAMSLFGLAP
jgi:hypothetical protein